MQPDAQTAREQTRRIREDLRNPRGHPSGRLRTRGRDRGRVPGPGSAVNNCLDVIYRLRGPRREIVAIYQRRRQRPA